MWLFALFDLPVDSKKHRREYARFRKELIRLGFRMLQFSVYAQYFQSEEAAAHRRHSVKLSVPPEGQVRLLAVTDHQFGKMDVIEGKRAVEPELPPSQLTLF